MSMSPEAVQLLSSQLNAVYFGATVGPNLAVPLTLTDDQKKWSLTPFMRWRVAA
jgi:hypothetical protein